MNRRSFFKRLAVGAAIIAVAPTVLAPTRELAYPSPFMPEFVQPGALSLAEIRALKAQLCSTAVKPFEGQYAGYIHPYVYADLVG